MVDSPISFESWLSFFPNQELAAQIRRIIGDGFLENPEEVLYNCVLAYHKAQTLYNLNPDNDITLETVSSPLVGPLTDTDISTVKTQKISHTVSFVSKLEISQSTIMGLQKSK